MPLVGDLRSPAMRDRHWDALREATKVGGRKCSSRCASNVQCTCAVACPAAPYCRNAAVDSAALPCISTHLLCFLASPAALPSPPLPSPRQVSFTLDASFRLSDLLKLELHKYAEDVGEIVDRAQKEEKMEVVSGAGGCFGRGLGKRARPTS